MAYHECDTTVKRLFHHNATLSNRCLFKYSALWFDAYRHQRRKKSGHHSERQKKKKKQQTEAKNTNKKKTVTTEKSSLFKKKMCKIRLWNFHCILA